MSRLPDGSTPSATSQDGWERHLGHPPPDDLRERLAAGSLAVVAHETALASPKRPAIAVDGESLSHGELDDQAGRMAAWLRRSGVRPSDVVLISSPSSLAFVIAYLGVLRAGCTALLANPAYTESELEGLVADSGAALALAARPGAEPLKAVAERASPLRVRDLTSVMGELDALAAIEPQSPGPGTPAILAYTSGTTGRPKAVPLSDANLLASIRAVMQAWRWERDDVLVHALPLFHQHGLGALHAALVSGSSTIVRSRFRPEDVCRVIGETRATVLFGVPSIYLRLADWEGIEVRDLSRLRLLVSGSAPLSPGLAERVAELAGQPPLERYGLTESGLDVSNPYAGERRAGFVGLALPGVELEIAGERGEALPAGQDGEIVLRGPQVFEGYHDAGGETTATAAGTGTATPTAEAFYPGGWFRTGDLGRIDPRDGYLQITGRLKELIISGGMNVYPREVELVLEGNPGVNRAAVVGIPSEQWGEAVVAAIVPAPSGSVTEEELLRFARERLAPFKCPKRVVVVDELPVNSMGKVVASAVRKLF